MLRGLIYILMINYVRLRLTRHLNIFLFPEMESHYQHGWQCCEAVEGLVKRWHLSMRDIDKLIRYLKIPYFF